MSRPFAARSLLWALACAASCYVGFFAGKRFVAPMAAPPPPTVAVTDADRYQTMLALAKLRPGATLEQATAALGFDPPVVDFTDDPRVNSEPSTGLDPYYYVGARNPRLPSVTIGMHVIPFTDFRPGGEVHYIYFLDEPPSGAPETPAVAREWKLSWDNGAIRLGGVKFQPIP